MWASASKGDIVPSKLPSHLSSELPTFSLSPKSNSTSPSAMETTHPGLRRVPNLLSLPDEALYDIFTDLGASRTNFNLLGPRQALPLALTNTRLFNIFRSMLTTIQPDVDPRNSSAVRPKSLLSLARIAGEHLREIHIPAGSSGILSELLRACPNLEYLHLVQGEGEELSSAFSDIINRQLTTLAINGVTRKTLSLITTIPQDLTLTRMDQLCFENLKRLLVQPPKKLCLLFAFSTETENIPELRQMIENIAEICPRVKHLTVKVEPDNDWNLDNFESVVKQHVEQIRRNARNSLCRKVSLSNKSTFPILSKVHPEAYVSLTSGNVEFADKGNGVFIRSMILRDEFLDLNLSRVHTIQVADYTYNPRWKDLLKRLILKYALVRTLRQAEHLNVTAIVLNVAETFDDEEDSISRGWDWVTRVGQLELPAPQTSISSSQLTKHFSILSKILDAYYGSAVWIDNFQPVNLEDEISTSLVETGKKLLRSVEEFENRGGDAECVRDMVVWMLGDHVRT